MDEMNSILMKELSNDELELYQKIKLFLNENAYFDIEIKPISGNI